MQKDYNNNMAAIASPTSEFFPPALILATVRDGSFQLWNTSKNGMATTIFQIPWPNNSLLGYALFLVILSRNKLRLNKNLYGTSHC